MTLLDQVIWWSYGKKLHIVFSHPAKIDSHRHYVNGYAITLVCQVILKVHVISQNHQTKGWSNIMSWSPSWQVTSLPILVAIDTVALET